MSLTKISNVNYAEKKATALTTELVQKKVLLSELDIDTTGAISYKGTKVASDEGVLKELYKILSINQAMVKKINTAGGEKIATNFLNFIKTALTFNDVKKSQVTLVAHKDGSIINHILPGDKDVVSNKKAIELFERTMSKQNNTEIVAFDINRDGGLSINVKTNTEITPRRKDEMVKGEEFNPGYSFNCNPLSGLAIDSFVHRLVCTNGMTVQESVGRVKITQLSESEIRRFFDKFLQLQKNGFVSFEFDANLNKAMNTRASFAELKQAHDIMINNSAIKTENDLFSFLPEFKSEVNRLARKGFDYAKLNERQLENWAVKSTVWDVVNRVTDFGSHDYGWSAQAATIQRQIGKVFTKKTFDTENILILN